MLFGYRAIEEMNVDDFRTGATREASDRAPAGGRIPLLALDAEAMAAMIASARQQFASRRAGHPRSRDRSQELAVRRL
jgi:hypothetical protein